MTKERIEEILRQKIAEHPKLIQPSELDLEIYKLALRGLAAQSLLEALEFYANEESWTYQKDFFCTSDVIEDDLSDDKTVDNLEPNFVGGKRARQAIEQYKNGGGG